MIEPKFKANDYVQLKATKEPVKLHIIEVVAITSSAGTHIIYHCRMHRIEEFGRRHAAELCRYNEIELEPFIEPVKVKEKQ